LRSWGWAWSPNPKAISNALLRRNALTSAKLPLDQIDRCPEDLLNRILWHAMRGPDEPYPQWAVITGLEEDEDDRD
jgi:hypothetical protein